jgi:hypothetical protein
VYRKAGVKLPAGTEGDVQEVRAAHIALDQVQGADVDGGEHLNKFWAARG